MIVTSSSGRGMEAKDRGRQMVNAGTQCGKQVLTPTQIITKHPAVMRFQSLNKKLPAIYETLHI